MNTPDCEKPKIAPTRVNVLLGAAGVTVLGVLASAHTVGAAGFPECPFHRLTGLYCPGCGTIRAIHALLHGDPLSAFRYNPLAVLSLPLLILLALESAGEIGWIPIKWCPPVTSRISKAAPWVIIGYGVLRNLPFFPFTLLAPFHP
jgi:hypothetical protein